MATRPIRLSSPDRVNDAATRELIRELQSALADANARIEALSTPKVTSGETPGTITRDVICAERIEGGNIQLYKTTLIQDGDSFHFGPHMQPAGTLKLPAVASSSGGGTTIVNATGGDNVFGWLQVSA